MDIYKNLSLHSISLYLIGHLLFTGNVCVSLEMRPAALMLALLGVVHAKAPSMDLCHRENFFNITSYKYREVPLQNCNCTEKTKCVRKCCADGFYGARGICIKGDVDFHGAIPIYKKKDFVRSVSVQDGLLAGVMNCGFFLYKSNASVGDFFYVQEDGSLWTTSYGSVRNDDYCVDWFSTGDLGVFICYDATKNPSQEINVAGSNQRLTNWELIAI